MMSLHFIKADDGEVIPNTIDDGSEAKVVELYPERAETDPVNERVQEEDVYDDEDIDQIETNDQYYREAFLEEAANELIDELTEESTEA